MANVRRVTKSGTTFILALILPAPQEEEIFVLHMLIIIHSQRIHRHIKMIVLALAYTIKTITRWLVLSAD